MVDNSRHMGDKQQLLAEALPRLIRRFTNPRCLDASLQPTRMIADDNGECPSGTPEFPPLLDLHVGVITSSLGAHGGTICTEPEANDGAQLLPKAQPALPLMTWNDSGFLSWSPDPMLGSSDREQFSSGVVDMVTNNFDETDLQYACIFPLPHGRLCSDIPSAPCECGADSADYNRAVCNGTTQTHGRAYPSVRPLAVLKAFGAATGNAVTASICPKSLVGLPAANYYGYNPAMDALVGSMLPVLTDRARP